MRPRTLDELALLTGGRVLAAAEGLSASRGAPDDRRVRGVSIDSRAVHRGDLFVAIAGERTHGHRFVGAAFAGGAAAALVNASAASEIPAGTGPLIEVEDTVRALMALAADERAGLGATVVGITGSTGKTCTKDLAAAVLAAERMVVASPASFNNEIGLPLTILSATEATEVLICEMGARDRGHIQALCEVARPVIGIVTNVGVAHMALFGSSEAIANAKAELVESLPPNGTAILAADDEVVRGFAERTPARTVTFGLSPAADVRAERVALDDATLRARFVLVTPDGRAEVALNVAGRHMVANALAAAALGWTLGVGADRAAEGLAGAVVSASRMDVFETPDGIRVIDDAYNANPASMEAALQTVQQMAGMGRSIAVLGEMAELGPIADDEHERIGELVAGLGVAALVTVGDQARTIAAAASRAGVEPARIRSCDSVGDAIEAVREIAHPGDVVLVKASRVAGLERVAAALRGPSRHSALAAYTPSPGVVDE